MTTNDDTTAKLAADRIAELEGQLERFTKMLANLQDHPDSNGYRVVSDRVDAIVAELERLRAPKSQEPQDAGMPTHAKMLVGGIVCVALGLGTTEWALVVFGAGLAGASQAVRHHRTDD